MKKFCFEHLFLSLVSVVCATSVLASFIVTPYLSAQATAAGFSDVDQTTPYWQSILFLQGRGVVGGLPDGSFAPYNSLTRSELLKIVLRAKLGDVDNAFASNCFFDVNPADWFAKYVCYAKQGGIVNGYNDGTFWPYQQVTYWEALKVAFGVYGFLSATSDWNSILNQADQLRVGIPAHGEDILNRGEIAGLIAHIIAYVEQGPSSPYLSPYLFPPVVVPTATPPVGIGIICKDGWHSPAMQRQGACSDHGGIDDAASTDDYYVDESTSPPTPAPTYSPTSEPTSGVPEGADPTALCNDGTYSYAANHQGACSYHGGVSVFYK